MQSVKIVQLGDSGLNSLDEVSFQKSLRLANKHPSWTIIGIDVRKSANISQDNFIQLQNEFLSGLADIDHEVVRVESAFSVGYYDNNGEKIIEEGSGIMFDMESSQAQALLTYTKNIIDTCHQKLLPGGSLVFFSGPVGTKVLKQAISNSLFHGLEISEKSINPDKQNLTYWAKYYAEYGLAISRLRIQKNK